MLGIPFFGHDWYVPNLHNAKAVAAFGASASVQGACCGAAAATWGGRPCPLLGECGTLTLAEIALFNESGRLQVWWDNATATAIGYTTDEIWSSLDDAAALRAKACFAATHSMAGVVITDASMDVTSPGAFPNVKFIWDALQ